MSRICRAVLYLFLAASFCYAQTAPTTSTPVATSSNGTFQPAYYVGAGASYDYYGKTGFAAATEIGIRIGSTNVYSYTTMELTATLATIRTGAAYLFYQTGNWSLVALGDAGLATGSSGVSSGVTLGSFSAGGLVMYDIGARLTKGASHFYIGGGGRLVSTSTLGQTPIATITFGKGF